MRTLKKTLALVLCLAMVAGLCCFGTSAAFADAADIEYTEAVEVMNGLGVLKGDGTNFNPKGVLTRAEAAVMIAKLLGGDKLTATSTFKDMAGYEWAQNFAAFCELKGLILGDGKGNFMPGKTLTGYEFGLMLCRALGYKPAQEGVTADTFEIGTAALMKKNGLSAAIENFDGTVGLTREKAAALLLKALQTTMVEYNTLGTTITVGGTVITTGDGKATEVDNAAFDYRMDTYVDDAKMQLIESSFKDVRLYNGKLTATRATGAAVTETLTYYTSTDPLGTTTTTLTIGTNLGVDKLNNNYNVWTNGKTGIQQVVYAAVDKSVKTVTIVATALTPTWEDLAKAAGFSPNAGSYITSATNAYWVNYAGQTNLTGTPVAGAIYVLTSNNVNGTVDQVVRITKTVDVVKSISNSTNALTGAVTTTYAFESGLILSNVSTGAQYLIADEALAAKDVVLLTQTGAVYTAAKAAAVSGTYTGYATNNLGVTTYTVDGKVYSASSAAAVTGVSGTGLTALTTGAVANTAMTLYLDDAGNVAAVKGAVAASDYVYVAKVANINTADENGITTAVLSAVVYKADGTSAVLKVNSGVSAGNTGLYAITPAAAGKYDFAAKATGDDTITTLGTPAIVRGVSKLSAQIDSKTVYTDANTVVFYVVGTYGVPGFSVTPVTGTANFSAGTLTAAGMKTTLGTTVLKAGVISGAYAEAVASNVVFYKGEYSSSFETVAGTQFETVTYTVYKNGVAETISYKDVAASIAPVTSVGFHTTAQANLAAYSTNVTAVDSARATQALFNGTLTVATDGDFQVADAAIYDVTAPTQTYTGLIEAGKTVTVYIQYKVVGGVNVAEQIYVVGAAKNTYTISATPSANNVTATAGAATAQYQDVVTVTFTGAATADGVYELKNGATVLATVTMVAGQTPAAVQFIMPAANVTLSLAAQP